MGRPTIEELRVKARACSHEVRDVEQAVTAIRCSVCRGHGCNYCYGTGECDCACRKCDGVCGLCDGDGRCLTCGFERVSDELRKHAEQRAAMQEHEVHLDAVRAAIGSLPVG